jgi:hypothetical protein
LSDKWPENISQNHNQIPFPESFSNYSTFAAKMSEALTEKKEAKSNYKKKENYVPRYKRAWEKRADDNVTYEKRACLAGERVKRRKFAVFMTYRGMNFFGMQRNPEMQTIEEELLKAMLKNEWINQEGFVQPQLFQFQKAARRINQHIINRCQ